MYLSYETMTKEIAMSLEIWARLTAEVFNFSLAWLEPLNHEIGAELSLTSPFDILEVSKTCIYCFTFAIKI